MNPSTALAIAVRDELASAGVRRVVISPGSRSTPLALALAHAADAGWFELFIRIDERSAGFLALGLAKHSGEPTAVLCTSGSAVANLAPAVVEASYAGVPLVVLTADRPPSLRSTGANQTIDQVGFYGQLVRRSLDLSTGEQVGKHVTANSDRWRPDLQRALHASLGAEGAIGPVQINLGFVEPLIPDDPADLAVGMKPEVAVEAVRPGIAEPINHAFADLGYTTIPNKGVILLGDVPDPADTDRAIGLARNLGWPVISEPSGNGFVDGQCVQAAPILLDDEQWRSGHRPDIVLTVGRFGLDRSIVQLVREAKLHFAVGVAGRDRPDPLRTAAVVLPRVPLPPEDNPIVDIPVEDPQWLADWVDNGAALAKHIDDNLVARDFGGLHICRAVLDVLTDDDVLFVGASRSVRDVEIVMRARHDADLPRIVGNRGASGIDGLISTAWGLALAHDDETYGGGRTVAVFGDLAFLHDHNGLLTQLGERQPDLTIVVIDNDGGGIFSSLEQGQEQFADHFELLFGTPPGRDLCAVAQAAGVAAVRVTDHESLVAALAQPADGVSVIIASTADRAVEHHTRTQLGK